MRVDDHCIVGSNQANEQEDKCVDYLHGALHLFETVVSVSKLQTRDIWLVVFNIVAHLCGLNLNLVMKKVHKYEEGADQLCYVGLEEKPSLKLTVT